MSARRILLTFILGAAALTAAFACALAFPGGRSAIARTAIAGFLITKGFALERIDVTVGGGVFDARDVAIEEQGRPFFTGERIRVTYGAPGRAFGISSVEVQRPHLVISRAADGSYDIARLFGTGQGNESQGPPIRATVAIHDGSVDVLNRYSPARPGRAFSLRDIDVDATIAQGAISSATASMMLASDGRPSRVDARYRENDTSKIARATIATRDVSLAPIVDSLVSSSAFVVEGGSADLALHAYAAGWDDSGPQWHVIGSGAVRNGRLRTLPLAVPIRDVAGAFSIFDGTLEFSALTAHAADIPMHAAGMVTLLPTQKLGLRLQAAGQLSRVRKWLPFSSSLPLAGPMALAATVDGAPSSPHVDLEMHSQRALRYGSVPVREFRTHAYYHDGHVAVRHTFASYAGASVYGDGDIDLTAAPVGGQFVVSVRAPSKSLPWVADLESKGITRARVALDGPLMKLSGSGFAMTSGGEQKIRATVAASPERLVVETIAQDAHGGELIASAAVDRMESHELTGDLYARDFAAGANGAAVALPGVTRNRISAPRASGIVNGYASVRGTLDAPFGDIRLNARDVAFGGRRIGRVVVGGVGSGDAFRIQRLAVSGPDAGLEADGSARMRRLPNGRASIAAVLEGSAHVNLSTARIASGLRGTTDGSFGVAIDGPSWLAATIIDGTNASISGIPVREVRAVIGQRGDTVTVYAAGVDVAGGHVDAQGSLPGSSAGRLAVTARGVDLASLRGLSGGVRGGEIVAMANVGGTAHAPSISGAAVLNGAVYAGTELSGDTQADYRRGTLTVRGGRVVAAGSAASVDGTIGGLTSDDPNMALDVAMSEGDLAGLSAAFAPRSIPLTGVASAHLRATGSFARPTIAGQIASGAGTVRGVAFNDLQATFEAAPGSVDMQSGSVRFGSSRIAMAGDISQGSTRVRATSAHVDLDDFNDFFDGKDVLEGHGSLDLAIDSSPTQSDASGFVHLADSRISGVPLGSLDGRFRPVVGGVAVNIRQRGALAQADISASLTRDRFGKPQALADGTVRSLDLAALAPYVGAEDRGVSGMAHATVHASGHPGAYRADVAFGVDRARVRSTEIREATGDVSVDPRSLQVRALRLAIDGATLDARGALDRSGRLQAHAVADVSDLHALERFSKHPVSMDGAVAATIDASGTIARPDLHARVLASSGQVAHVAYDSLRAQAAYDRGTIVANGDVALADGHGDVRMAATLPVQTDPLRVGPNDRPVRLYGTASAVGIASLDPLLGNTVSGDGVLDGRLSVLGTVGKPQVSGDMHVRGATVRTRFDTVPLSNLNADVALARDTIDLQRAHAQAGSGTLDAHGRVHIVPATAIRPEPGLQYAFGATLHGAQVDVPNVIKGTVDAQLGMTKSAAVPYLFGDVAFSNTSVPFATILALASGQNTAPAPGSTIPGLPPIRKDHVVVYGGSIFGGSDQDHVLRSARAPLPRPATPQILPSSVGIGLKVTAGKNVGVSGLLNVIGTGTIDVSGDTKAPRLAGTLDAVRGRAGFLNTSFDLLDGRLTFKPKEGLIPTVSADAITRTDDADITVSIYGRVDQLHTDLQSDPPMNREAIVGTLLRVPQLNSALASSNGQEQSALGVSPQNLVSGVVAGQILGALNIGLEQVFNLEEVDFGIDPLGRPTLEVRKQVSPRAYTLYRTTFTVPPAQALGIAYQVRRALQIELSQSQSTPGILTTYALPQTSLVVRMTFH